MHIERSSIRSVQYGAVQIACNPETKEEMTHAEKVAALIKHYKNAIASLTQGPDAAAADDDGDDVM